MKTSPDDIIAFNLDSLRLEYDSACPRKGMPVSLFYFKLDFSKSTLRPIQVSNLFSGRTLDISKYQMCSKAV